LENLHASSSAELLTLREQLQAKPSLDPSQQHELQDAISKLNQELNDIRIQNEELASQLKE
jgi:hypothetical protein